MNILDELFDMQRVYHRAVFDCFSEGLQSILLSSPLSIEEAIAKPVKADDDGDWLEKAKEWVLDCWVDNYRDAPKNGMAHISGNCSRRTVRGGSWLYRARALRAPAREWHPIDTRRDDLGIRIARVLQQ